MLDLIWKVQMKELLDMTSWRVSLQDIRNISFTDYVSLEYDAWPKTQGLKLLNQTIREGSRYQVEMHIFDQGPYVNNSFWQWKGGSRYHIKYENITTFK